MNNQNNSGVARSCTPPFLFVAVCNLILANLNLLGCLVCFFSAPLSGETRNQKNPTNSNLSGHFNSQISFLSLVSLDSFPSRVEPNIAFPLRGEGVTAGDGRGDEIPQRSSDVLHFAFCILHSTLQNRICRNDFRRGRRPRRPVSLPL